MILGPRFSSPGGEGGGARLYTSLFGSAHFVGRSVSIQRCVKWQRENENIKAIFHIIHSGRCVRSHARTPTCARKLLLCYMFRQLNRCSEGDQSTTPILSTPKHTSQGLDGLDRGCQN